MIHELMHNKGIDYNKLLSDTSKVLKSIYELVDFSIFNCMTDSEDYIEVNNAFKVNKDKNNIIFYGKLNEECFLRICFINEKLQFVKIVHNANSKLILQIHIGDTKLLINESWFDRMEFESKAFQLDTTEFYPFSLLEINELFKILGI